MFDVATRPQPNTQSAGAVFGVPFDWRLTTPGPAAAYPLTSLANYSGTQSKEAVLLATYAMELEDTLATAIVISLFTDKRAGIDDRLPLNETNRRGWVGSEFMAQSATAGQDDWGTLLWLIYIGKVTADVPAFAEFTCKEALAWLVKSGIASRVTVAAQWVGDRLAIRPQIYKPEQTTPVYDALWGTSIRRFAQ